MHISLLTGVQDDLLYGWILVAPGFR